MSAVIFVLLAALSAVAIAYPLLTPRVPAQSRVNLSEAEIEVAVQRLRRAGKPGRTAVPASGPLCPACSAPYQPGDGFCVRCGQVLPQQEAAPTAAHESVCPSCGAALRADDLFCARCGHRLVAPAGGESLEEVQP